MKKFFVVFLSLLGMVSLYGVGKKPSEQKAISKIDLILVEKKRRTMSVYYQRKLLKEYKIALGFSPLGHKEQEGDGKTPEGVYFISAKYPQSQFYLALQISYPNSNDQQNARKKGVSAGGEIMIHGLGKGFGWLGKLHVNRDWTLGCIAVTNKEIKEIYNATTISTKVEIQP